MGETIVTGFADLVVFSLMVVLLLALAGAPVQGGETLPWGVDRIGSRCVWDNDMNMIVDEGANAGEIRIAVIDHGIDYETINDSKVYHQDLNANVLGGKGFRHWGCSVQEVLDYDDIDGHGTHVAGTIAAVDNTIGIIGTAPKAKIYALKLYTFDQKEVAAAINWAVGQGIRVISMSGGWDYSTEDLRTACDNAYNRTDGALLIAAAGNENTSIIYPAAYASVIAVGAVDQNGQRWVDPFTGDGSNFGSELEFVAPGVDINSTMLGGGYGVKNATSMACPHVAAVAALIFASKPDPDYDLDGDGWNNTEVRQKLKQLALDLGPRGRDDEYGYGLINAWATNQRPLGDVNNDRKVDLKDVLITQIAFGSFPGHPAWDQKADININNIVDLKDHFIVCINYGKIDP